MWTAKTRLFSTGPPKPPGRFSGFRRISALVLTPVLLYNAYVSRNKLEELYNQYLGTPPKPQAPPAKAPIVKDIPRRAISPPRAAPVENPESKKYKELLNQISLIKDNEKFKQDYEEREKKFKEEQASLAKAEQEKEKNKDLPQETKTEAKPQPAAEVESKKTEELKVEVVETDTKAKPEIPVHNEVSENKPVVAEGLQKDPQEVLVTQKTDTEKTEPSLSAKELETAINRLRSELHQDQQKRENELYNGIEDLFKNLISEYIPKTISSGSPARVISSNIDFSRLSADQISRKFEDLINAYQERLESLGVKNYDSFVERLKLQKDKWRSRMHELQEIYEKQIQDEVNARDEQWKKVLYEEAADSERHYETQAKIDSEYVRQETELELNKKFKNELDHLTSSLEKATGDRLAQLEGIIKKIKEMEVIQAEHYSLIVQLTKVHRLHVAIENIQRALLEDKGNLTGDLKVIIQESKNNENLKKTLEKIEPGYADIITKGIPKMKQILDEFEEAAFNAKRAALINSGTLANVLLSKIAVLFIPNNIKTIDDEGTLDKLRLAKEALGKGDLAKAKEFLNGLKGLPAEEVKNLVKNIELRLSFLCLVEQLSVNSVKIVEKIINLKAIS